MTPLQDNDPHDEYFYEVTVYTGDVSGSGTTANVSIILRGHEREVCPKSLCDPKRQCFQRTGIDTFLLSSPQCIGEINNVHIWHDNTGSSPAWFLDKIVVRDLSNKKSYLFLNEDWLAVEKGQGEVQTVLFPASYQETTGFKYLFHTTSQRSLKDRHLWFSVFARPVDSHFTRVQRLSCCLALFYCTMLANAMFYRRGNETSSESTVILGPFRFGVSEMGIGILSTLIILPVNVIFVWIFRNVESKPCDKDILALKANSSIWWFYEMFFCCFKSRDCRQGLNTIVTESTTNSGGSSVDINLKDANEMVREINILFTSTVDSRN